MNTEGNEKTEITIEDIITQKEEGEPKKDKYI